MNAKASFVLGILLTISIILIFKTMAKYSSSIDSIYTPIFISSSTSTSSASTNKKFVSN